MCKICEDLMNRPIPEHDSCIEIRVQKVPEKDLDKYWSLIKYWDGKFAMCIDLGTHGYETPIKYCPYCGCELKSN